MLDYLESNPTRNRPLDLLPLFSDMDKALVISYPVERELIKPRPTFHYRLPNSQVDAPNWTIAEEWNRWIEVETLACDRRVLNEACSRFGEFHDRPGFTKRDWVTQTRTWLHG